MDDSLDAMHTTAAHDESPRAADEEQPVSTNGAADKAKKRTKDKGKPASMKFPLQRVRKIARFDDDIQMLSTSASLIICGAAEKFATYYAEQAYRFAQAEGKKSLQYKHCAKAAARAPALEFLSDVVPPTTTYGEVKQKRQKAAEDVAHAAGDDRIRRVEDESEIGEQSDRPAKPPGSGIKLKFKTGKVPAWARPKAPAAATAAAAAADSTDAVDGQSTVPEDEPASEPAATTDVEMLDE